MTLYQKHLNKSQDKYFKNIYVGQVLRQEDKTKRKTGGKNGANLQSSKTGIHLNMLHLTTRFPKKDTSSI